MSIVRNALPKYRLRTNVELAIIGLRTRLAATSDLTEIASYSAQLQDAIELLSDVEADPEDTVTCFACGASIDMSADTARILWIVGTAEVTGGNLSAFAETFDLNDIYTRESKPQLILCETCGDDAMTAFDEQIGVALDTGAIDDERTARGL